MLEGLFDYLRLSGIISTFFLNALISLALLLAGLIIARLAKRALVGAIARSRASTHLVTLLGNVTFVGVLVVALLLILRVYGLDATALLAILGVGTVAIGLALQDMLKNLFAGIYLLIEQPFQAGDTIIVDGREGEVESIDARVTVLRLRDGTQALVPNAVVLATTVTNRTAYSTRRLSVRLAGLSDDLAAIDARLQSALRDHPDLAPTPPPLVQLEATAGGKLTVVADLWRPARREPSPALLTTLQAAFPEAELSVRE